MENKTEMRQTFLARVGLINTVVIILSGGFAVYILGSLWHDPFNSLRSLSYLLFFLVGIVLFNRLFAVMRRLSRRSLVGFVPRLLVLLGQLGVSLVIPVLLIAIVDPLINARELDVVTQHFAPMISAIEHARTRLGHPPHSIKATVTAGPALNFHYAYDKKSYLLATNGSSIDIDGSTLLYLPSIGRWQRIHNDFLTSPNAPAWAKHYLSMRHRMTIENYHL